MKKFVVRSIGEFVMLNRKKPMTTMVAIQISK